MATTITPVVTGDYLAPEGHRQAGQRIVAVAYLVRRPGATLLFDTGFPFDEPTPVNESTDDELWTYPRPLAELLSGAGATLDALDLVANCHLHIDHAGGNYRLPPELPIYAQAAELAIARVDEEEIVQRALALDRQAYRPIEGEVELLPGVRVVPSPGHTAGHQSLVVETDAGPVILAGQAVSGATEFATFVYADRLRQEASEPVPTYPDWLPGLLANSPVEVRFAHDLAIWRPEPD